MKWIFTYLILARFFKIWSKNVQIHSIIHCITSVIWASHVLFIYLDINLLTTNVYPVFLNLSSSQQQLIKDVVFHSSGYFIADTIDILIDYQNVKRRIYIIHHLAAIAGIATVYTGSYSCIYAIWCLEIGGIVHHLKHAVENNNCDKSLYYITQVIYHVIYLSSRMLLTINVINYIIYNNHNTIDLFGISMAFILLIQNYVWWLYNLKRSIDNIL